MGKIGTRNVPLNGNGISQRQRRFLKIDKFRGADYSVAKIDVDSHRATYIMNKINVNGVNHKRNGWAQRFEFNDKINGFWDFKLNDKLFSVCYAGNKFYLYDDDTNAWTDIITGNTDVNAGLLADRRTSMYIRNNNAYFIGCGDFLVFGKTEDGYKLRRVYDDADTYIPITTAQISRDGSSVNTSRYTRDDPNMLTGYRKNTLVGEAVEGHDVVYVLDHTAYVSSTRNAVLEVKDVPVGSTNLNGKYDGVYIGGAEVQVNSSDGIPVSEDGESKRVAGDSSALEAYVFEENVYPSASDCWDAELEELDPDEKWAMQVKSGSRGDINYCGYKWERDIAYERNIDTGRVLTRSVTSTEITESNISTSGEYEDEVVNTGSQSGTVAPPSITAASSSYDSLSGTLAISGLSAEFTDYDFAVGYGADDIAVYMYVGASTSTDSDIMNGAVKVKDITSSSVAINASDMANAWVSLTDSVMNNGIAVTEDFNDKNIFLFSNVKKNGTSILCSELYKIDLENGAVTGETSWSNKRSIAYTDVATDYDRTYDFTKTCDITRTVTYTEHNELKSEKRYVWRLNYVETVDGVTEKHQYAQKTFIATEYSKSTNGNTFAQTDNGTRVVLLQIQKGWTKTIRTLSVKDYQGNTISGAGSEYVVGNTEPNLPAEDQDYSQGNTSDTIAVAPADESATPTASTHLFNSEQTYVNPAYESFQVPEEFVDCAVISDMSPTDDCTYNGDVYFFDPSSSEVLVFPFTIQTEVYGFIPYADNNETKYYVTLTGRTLKISEDCDLAAPTLNANLTLTFYAESPKSDNVTTAKYSTVYGVHGASDMLFVANPDDGAFGNKVFYSETDNFTYFSDRQSRTYGSENTPVIAFIRGTDGSLIVHKSFSQYEPSVYRTEGSWISGFYDREETEPYTYASFTASGSVAPSGCIAPYSACGLANDSLFLSGNGVCSVVLSDVTSSQRFIRERSVPINRALMSCKDLNNAQAITYDNRYYLAVDGKVFIADARYINTPEEAMNDTAYYEWYVWDNLDVSAWFIRNETLWFGTNDGKVCEMSSGEFYDETAIWFNDDDFRYSVEDHGITAELSGNGYAVNENLGVEVGDVLIDSLGYEHIVTYSAGGHIEIENDVDTNISGVVSIVRRQAVKDEFVTAILCPGSNVYEKMIHAITVTLYGDANNSVDIKWAYSRGEGTYEREKTGFTDQSDDFNFYDFGFVEVTEGSMRQTSFTKRVSMPKANYVVMSFSSDKPYDSAVNSFSIEYSITGTNKGVK